MTNSTAQWEQAVLNKLTSNGERIAVVEKILDRIETDLSDLKSDMSDVKNELSGINQRLSGIEKFMEKIDSILGLLKWIGGGIAAIALSLIANFVYSLFA